MSQPAEQTATLRTIRNATNDSQPGSSERRGLRWLHALSDRDEFAQLEAVVAAYAVSRE
jgi:hypothetical protein